jgi:tetratricopeptide (TPR) repeat protein
MCAQLAGDTDEAEARVTEARRIGLDGGQHDANHVYGTQLLSLMAQRGTVGEMGLEQWAAQLPESLIDGVTAVRASRYAEVGRLEDARRLLEAFAAAGFELRPDAGNQLVWMIRYAMACVVCRDTAIAAALFDRLRPFADQVGTVGRLLVDEPVSHVLGGLATVLGRYDEADAYYAHAAAFNDRAAAKFLAANNNLFWAAMLTERDAPGDNERARELLTRAQTAAAANGYAGIERRATEALEHLD